MEYTEISYEADDRVLTITLDRPDRLNAFTHRMHEELLDAFDRADADDDVRVVIVTGRGRGFCSGADLGGGGGTFDRSERREQQKPHRDEGGLVSLRIFRSTKPVIAAVNGPAVGVGVTMTLPMDIRLASETARFGFVFARRGIVPEAASSWFLPRVVGINKAAEWAYTGRVFPAQEALEAGLVRSIHPAEALLPAAYEIAHEIADNTSAVSVALTRQMLWRMLGEPHPMSAHRVDSKVLDYMGAAPDAREGVESFLEKRPPAFSMRPSTDMPEFYPWWDEPEF
jgi:enoyl-CoA hydratase/carnithine racemase